MSIHGKWGWTQDEQSYHGAFDTPEAAAADIGEEGESVMVGQYRDPIAPELCVKGDDLFELTVAHEDYSGEWAEDAFSCTQEQEDEFTDAVRQVYGEWLDKHNLRPGFGIVECTKVVTHGA